MTDRGPVRSRVRWFRVATAGAMVLLFVVMGLYLAGGQVVRLSSDHFYVCISNRQRIGMGAFVSYDSTKFVDPFMEHRTAEPMWRNSDHAGWTCDFQTFSSVYQVRVPFGWQLRVIFAWWLAIALPIPLALVRLIAYLRRNKPITDGRVPCPGCGYDLRASVDRCPECGRPIAPLDMTTAISPPSRRWIVWPWLAILVAAYTAAWLAHRARPGLPTAYGPEWAWHNGLTDVAILIGFVLTGLIAVHLTRVGRPAIPRPRRLLIAASVLLPWFTLFVQ